MVAGSYRTRCFQPRGPNLAYISISTTAVEKFPTYEEIPIDPRHATLDSKVLARLDAILHGDFRKQMYDIKKKFAHNQCMMQGRQLAWLIRDHFRKSTSQGELIELKDLFRVKVMNDNVEVFLRNFIMLFFARLT